MAWNQFVGITMLLYALTNPVGAVPIFLAMTRKVESVKIHRIIVLASAAVAVFFMGLGAAWQADPKFLQCRTR
jgi:small neutral amino acid transporter SnatA (MarC family)